MRSFTRRGEHQSDNVVVLITALAAAPPLDVREVICFMARFNGVPRKLEIPMNVIKGIFAKEVNQGIALTPDKGNECQKILRVIKKVI